MYPCGGRANIKRHHEKFQLFFQDIDFVIDSDRRGGWLDSVRSETEKSRAAFQRMAMG
jgi:hypothetical protein